MKHNLLDKPYLFVYTSNIIKRENDMAIIFWICVIGWLFASFVITGLAWMI